MKTNASINVNITDSARVCQMARAVRSRISLPSSKIRSQTRRTAALGRQVANRVKNHCMVNTLVSGGSMQYDDDEPVQDSDC